jgi:hypothetical protein
MHDLLDDYAQSNAKHLKLLGEPPRPKSLGIKVNLSPE